MKPYFNEETSTIYINSLKGNKNIIAREISVNGKKEDVVKKKEYSVYVTKVSEEDISAIRSYKSLSEDDKNSLKARVPNVIFDNVLILGNANKKRLPISSFSDYLQKEVRVDRGASLTDINKRQEYYRNYERRYETWENNCMFVNSCPDVKMSWQSIIRKLGAKGVHGINNSDIPFYVIIWYDTLTEEEMIKKWQL